MIQKEKCLVIDVDGTICPIKRKDQDYMELEPYPEIVARLREYHNMGFTIILFTSRNMRTYDGNIGLINANTTKVLINWLDRHEIPYDELHVGKPWPGKGGFYVDDRAIRPDEFRKLSYDQIQELLSDE